MAIKKNSDKLHTAIENYYYYNPDTLMPLLLLTLAAKGKLLSTTEHIDGYIVLCEINPSKIIEYDWVRFDSKLKKRVAQAILSGINKISIEGFVDNTIMDIYDILHHYDTHTVEEEYRHKMGTLYRCSSDMGSDYAHRQYAMFLLAETLMEKSKDYLNNAFLFIYNYILEKSKLQPERPRLKVAYALSGLLNYNGIGKIYNPFGGCAIAAASITAGDNLYVDCDENEKIFAVARLLNYGMGGSNVHYVQRDSKEWIEEGQLDYVLSTYRGNVNGKSAFDFCLSKCFDTLSEYGKYAGIASPKVIFDNQSAEFKEALRRDWIESILALPYGEVAVLVNAKKEKRWKSKIKFYNLLHPMHRGLTSDEIFNNDIYRQILRVSDVKKKKFLQNLIVSNIEDINGYEIVRLGDYVKKLRRQMFSLERVASYNRTLAFIDRTNTYNQFQHPWMNGINKTTTTSLFAPAYHLTKDCLITNNKGLLEPRLFRSYSRSAYFMDGYAFELNEGVNGEWLVEELNEQYVISQLYPYGIDKLISQTITEEQILNLQIYRRSEANDEQNRNSDSLPIGYELDGENFTYTIHKFLGNGAFGYAYSALAKNIVTGENKEVVIKEFYPHRDCYRDGEELKVEFFEYTEFDIDAERNKFCEEARIMRTLGNTPDSHIVPAEELFESPKTGTLYYIMPFYHLGSLEDLQKSGTIFTEELLINHIVKPLCKALHIAHNARVLHLDIKPDNILIDDDGDAALTDFGVAKQYDNDDNIIDKRGTHSTTPFAAPEMKPSGSPMVRFGSEPDIFALSATLYNLATGSIPHPIHYNSDDDSDLIFEMEEAKLSNKFINAIIKGLQAGATERPGNAQAFLNLFPGCENIKL